MPIHTYVYTYVLASSNNDNIILCASVLGYAVQSVITNQDCEED